MIGQRPLCLQTKIRLWNRLPAWAVKGYHRAGGVQLDSLGGCFSLNCQYPSSIRTSVFEAQEKLFERSWCILTLARLTPCSYAKNAHLFHLSPMEYLCIAKIGNKIFLKQTETLVVYSNPISFYHTLYTIGAWLVASKSMLALWLKGLFFAVHCL